MENVQLFYLPFKQRLGKQHGFICPCYRISHSCKKEEATTSRKTFDQIKKKLLLFGLVHDMFCKICEYVKYWISTSNTMKGLLFLLDVVLGGKSIKARKKKTCTGVCRQCSGRGIFRMVVSFKKIIAYYCKNI